MTASAASIPCAALALCPALYNTTTTSFVSPLSGKGHTSNDGTVRLATIWFGTNDCIAPGFAQHVPIDEYESNVRTILHQYFTQVEAVLLLTPATVVPGRFEGHMDDVSMVEYGTRLKNIAAEYNREQTSSNDKPGSRIVVVDMHAVFVEAGKKTGSLEPLFQQDGLHIAPQGYKVVYDAVMTEIKGHFSHLLPEALDYVFPIWRTLNLSADHEQQVAQMQPKRTLA